MRIVKNLRSIATQGKIILVEGITEGFIRSSGIYKVEETQDQNSELDLRVEVKGISISNRGELLQLYIENCDINVYELTLEDDPEYFL